MKAYRNLYWIITALAINTSVFAGAGLPVGITLDNIATVAVSGKRRPVAIRNAADGSGRLFIVLQNGEILIYQNNTLLATPFLDISARVEDSGGEQGLLGLAFHPDFPNNGNNYIYLNYTYDPPGAGLDRTVIARYSVPLNTPDQANPNSEQVLLEIEQDSGNHNGGDIHFGPDGYLYIGMGDGGGANDTLRRAQDPSSLLGKMLRIDVNGTAPAEPNDLCGLNRSGYAIPPDNPFVTIFQDGFEVQAVITAEGTCDEIWAMGLRNPWRWSFDRATGDMIIGDVGQNAKEEISFQPAGTAGLNFGWRCREADLPLSVAVNDAECINPIIPFSEPILVYGRDLGFSVTGGYRYRGAYAPLQGYYIYADFGGRIWFASENAGNWTTIEWTNTNFAISTFGEDENGELYLADLSTGNIYRFSTP